ncbi:MAG: hypothetical protein GY906_17285 [bacterium]|nr:hypothetical protein [bacterium]
MRIPNLASQPFLNARPVWLVTIGALTLAVIFLGFNIHAYLSGNRQHGEKLSERVKLEAEQRVIEGELRADVGQLDQVSWRGLRLQVSELNIVLRQQGFSWLVLLRDIEEVLPRDVRLTRIAPSVNDAEVQLAISGLARSRDAMLLLLENLIENQDFSDPVPNNEIWPEGSDRGIYEFTLRVRYLAGEERP